MPATCNIPDKYEVTWDEEKRMREPGERRRRGEKEMRRDKRRKEEPRGKASKGN